MNSIDNQLMASIGGKLPSKIPVELNICLTVSMLIISYAVGFFLNVSTFATVIRHRQHQIRRRLRIISLLGFVFSYLLLFVPIVILLLINFDFDGIECLCKAHAIVAGLSTHALFLLLNITLALIDRYMTASSSVDHPDAETRSNANSSSNLTCATITSLSLMLLMLILMKFVYFVVFGHLIVQCETWVVRFHIVGTVVLVVLFVSCILLNWIVYKESKNVLGSNAVQSRSFNQGTCCRVDGTGRLIEIGAGAN